MVNAGRLELGRVVERYRVEERLGEGGTAAVYRVRHLHLGTDHALKVLTLVGAHAAPRLLLEGRIQAALRHPNILAVTDVLEVDGSWGLLMEYVPPPNLAGLLFAGRPPLAEAEALFRGVVAGVAHAHRHGLVHRDLKPHNVLLAEGEGGRVAKVADFGLARLLEGDEGHRQTRSGLAMGTPPYMAPEQFRDAKGVDRRADLFSLGCLLHELVSGRPTFAWTDMMRVYQSMMERRWAPLPDDVPERIRQAIAGCLEPEADDRIPDCAALLAVLDGAERRGSTLVPDPEPIPPTSRVPDTWSGPDARGSDVAAVGADDGARTVVSARLPASEPVAPTLVGAPPSVGAPPAHDTLVAPPAALLTSGTLADPGTLLPDVDPPRLETRSRAPAVVLAIAALVAGLVAWTLLREPDPARIVDAAPLAEVPAAPPPAAPATEPAAPQPTVTPVTPRPVVAPPRPSPRPATPAVVEAAPAPAPTVVATPTTASVPAAIEATPAVAAPSRATVAFTGARAAWLMDGERRLPLPGKVPAGRYDVWADFGAGGVKAGELDAAAGDEVSLRCSEGFQRCN